jgi:hypothetical protein
MPRRLPLYVERNYVKGHTYLSFRRGKGSRIRLPSDPTKPEFLEAYQTALAGQPLPAARGQIIRTSPGSVAALITSYKKSAEYVGLRETTKSAYNSRLETLREDHGHRSVAGTFARAHPPCRSAALRRSARRRARHVEEAPNSDPARYQHRMAEA